MLSGGVDVSIETTLTLITFAGILVASLAIRLIAMAPVWAYRYARYGRFRAARPVAPAARPSRRRSPLGAVGRFASNVVVPVGMWLAAITASAVSHAAIRATIYGRRGIVLADRAGDRFFGWLCSTTGLCREDFSFLSASSIAEEALWRQVGAEPVPELPYIDPSFPHAHPRAA